VCLTTIYEVNEQLNFSKSDIYFRTCSNLTPNGKITELISTRIYIPSLCILRAAESSRLPHIPLAEALLHLWDVGQLTVSLPNSMTSKNEDTSI
jgi:hypothetical protein